MSLDPSTPPSVRSLAPASDPPPPSDARLGVQATSFVGRESLLTQQRNAAARIERGSALAADSFDLRCALCIAKERLDQYAPPVDAWHVSASGHWFGAPGKPRVEIATSALLRALIRALVQAHGRSEHSVVTYDELIRELWPNERIIRKAALNRLFVLIAKLRQLGWRDALESVSGGYRVAAGTKLLILSDRPSKSDSPRRS